MLYGLIPLIASLILGVRYLAFGEASVGSKVAVATVVAAGLVIWWRYPQWVLVATLLQAAVSIYVLIYLKVMHLSMPPNNGMQRTALGAAADAER